MLYLCWLIVCMSTLLTLPEKNNFVDISYCIADIKFQEEKFKVCEFGLCTWSMFKGYTALHGTGSLWKQIWQHLHSFSLPVWYVGIFGLTPERKKELSYETFCHHGGIVVENLEKLARSELFIQATQKKVINPEQINNYQGIVVLRHHKEKIDSIKKFRQQYPGIIIMDSVASKFVNNKLTSNELFMQAKLEEFKPFWKAYPKHYAPQIAQELCAQPYSAFVIKPLNSSEGRGVIIVEAKNLDMVLQHILSQNKTASLTKDVGYDHWLHDKNEQFLIEAYEPSKYIKVENMTYDATMRIIFCLYYDNLKPSMKYLAHYWKLPFKSIEESGTLNEKHKSKINPGRVSSAIVDQCDAIKIQEQTAYVLPKIYNTMIECYQKIICETNNSQSAQGALDNAHLKNEPQATLL